MSAAPLTPTRDLVLPRRHRVTPQPTGGALTGPACPSAGLPIDEHQVMNTVLHHALRRDLRRLGETLRAPVSAAQQQALAGHVEFLLDRLHHHHSIEDDLMWPAALRRRPQLHGLFEQMEDEHACLRPAVTRLTVSTADWADETGRPAVHDAVIALEAALEPHLQHEEADAMPQICSALCKTDWAPIDREMRRPATPAKMAQSILWMLDDLDPDRSVVVEGLLPRQLWRILRLRYAPGWRRRQALLWG